VDKVVDSGDKCGVIKLGTGFGKTIMALEIIRKLQLTALIIVPRVSILNQFKQELKKYYDYEAGIIQGKTWDIKEITIASMATLRRQNNSRILQKRFSVVFSDEVHTNISDKGISVIQSFNPKFLYGLTATARRTDEQSEAIFFTFGNIIIDRVLPQKAPKVQVVKSNANIEVSIDYHEMILDQTENEERNKLIVKLSMEELKTNRKILILTKRIEHYKKISGFFDDKVKVFEVSSDTKQSERDELLTKLRNNEIDYDVILGTYSMLSTGVDCPSLDTLIFAGDIKSDVLAEQSIGRILRLFEGKSDPKIIDIDDNLNPMLHRQFLERRKFYNKNNWQIIN
jgi:superfamily II DNA or RNA helicase